MCKLPSYKKSVRGSKKPDITDDQLKDFTNRYLEDISIAGRGINATKLYIIENTGWSLAQAHIVVMQIAKQCKRQW